MQAVVVLPTIPDTDSPDDWYKRLCQKVSGLPLVIRVLATAARSGVTSVVVVRTSTTPADWIRKRLQSPLISAVPIRVIGVEPAFDPTQPASWSLLAPALEPRFLWLPWNYVTLRRSLASIVSSGPRPDRGGTDGWDRPRVVVTDALLIAPATGRHCDARGAAVSGAARCEPAGIAVTSDDTRRETERLLVRGSGKSSDGTDANFNQRLCRPAVRWLSNTPVTANAVTMMGLPVTILSAYWYAQGHWSAYVIGALLYYLSVLIDEVEGMLARTKFQESPFGSWLETLTGYARYLSLWGGMSIGLSRQFGTPIWLDLGGLTIVMSVLRLVVLRRRRVATAAAIGARQ